MAEQGYFPGCSLEGSAGEYDKSTRLVCRELGISLKELPDWSCCGAHAAHHARHSLSTMLGVRNLNIAVRNGLRGIVAPCPACYNRLKAAQAELNESKELRERAAKRYEFKYEPQLEVSSILEMLAGVDKAELKKRVKKDLSKLRVVAYYGCLLVRPPNLVRFDDPEAPVSMDGVLSAVGATVLPWDYKVQCCGASMAISDPEIHARLSCDILEMAQLAGAEALVVACPLCHANLDLKQGQVNRRRKRSFSMPIFYLPQVIGLAFGKSPGELGLDKHMVDPAPLLNRL